MAMGKIYNKAPAYKTSLQKVAKKVKAVNDNFKKRVKRAVGQFRDKRYLFYNETASFSNSGGYFSSILSSTTLGDGVYAERQGDTITPTRLNFRWSWAMGDEQNQVRMILFQWRPDDNSLPPTGAITNILNSTPLGSSAAALAQLVYDQKNFHVLYDSLHHVEQQGYPIINGVHTIYGKKMLKIRYTNGVSAGHNMIYGLAISDSSLATHPQLIISATLEYDA